MADWTIYPVFAASIISVAGLTHIAIKYHDKTSPRSLSELAATEQRLLARLLPHCFQHGAKRYGRIRLLLGLWP